MKKFFQPKYWPKNWSKNQPKNRPKQIESSWLLTEIRSNDLSQGNNQANYPDNSASLENTFSTNEEQLTSSLEHITPRKLADILGVAPETIDCVDGAQPISEQQRFFQLIQRSAVDKFPEPPADLNGNLLQHLETVEESVGTELGRLQPLLDPMGLMGCLIDCYLHQMFGQLHYLLQDVTSTKNCVVLMKWVVQSCPSRDFLSLEKLDPTKRVDPLLFSKWFIKAKDRLLDIVQRDVKGYLDNILQNEKNQDGCCNDEAYVRLYVDTIGCIKDMPKAAQDMSSELSRLVQDVCFRELLEFLERYSAEQTEILSKEAKKDRPEMWHFFKTLNTCKELKYHVQDKGTTIQRSLLQQTVAALEKIEDFTLKLFREIVADLAETHLRNYFKKNKRFLLIHALEKYFLKAQYSQDIQERVMDDAYKLIVNIYIKHLFKTSQRKLKKCWSSDVGEEVKEDARLLHETITNLAPGVQQWNQALLDIVELLECSDPEAMKLIVGTIQGTRQTWREDQNLLPTLLRWKGLPQWQVTEVLGVVMWHQPRSASWFSSLKCC